MTNKAKQLILLIGVLFGATYGADFEIPDSGTTVEMKWDSRSSELVITAKVPNGSWLGWGWGSSMTETSMITWSANG